MERLLIYKCSITNEGSRHMWDASTRAKSLESRQREQAEYDAAVEAMVRATVRAARSLRSAAAQLNAAGVPTRTGKGEWTHMQVRRVLARLAARTAAAEPPEPGPTAPVSGPRGSQ